MKRSYKSIATITLAILVGFLLLAFSRKNYEFIGYWVVLVGLLVFVLKFGEKFKIPSWGLALFSIWSILHMVGGLIIIGGTRLYDLILLNLVGEPFFILRFDQVLHAYCYFMVFILIYFVLKKYVSKKDRTALLIFSVLAAMGIGVLNEIIEFAMVVFAGAAEAVGDYHNNALDLVFNLIGSIIAAFYMRYKDNPAKK